MHELSVARALLRQVERLAGEHRALAVRGVTVRIGPLSGVEPGLLARAFPRAAAGSVADGAELRIESVAVRVHCEDCGAEGEAAPNRLACPACGSLNTRLAGGDEMLLVSLELETSDV